MYEVDNKDKVVELKEVPQSSVGAPNPIVMASENDVFLTYYLEDTIEAWDGKTARMVDSDSDGVPVAVVKFKQCTVHMFGPPNDGSFSGHPLAARGLGPYGVYEIKNSSWIRKLERMNAVHPFHVKKQYMLDKKHFVFSFHDSTFECVTTGFTIEECTGSVRNMLSQMLDTFS